MARINFVTTPSFEAALAQLMVRRGFATKSEAIRTIIEETAKEEAQPWSAKELLGYARTIPKGPNARDDVSAEHIWDRLEW